MRKLILAAAGLSFYGTGHAAVIYTNANSGTPRAWASSMSSGGRSYGTTFDDFQVASGDGLPYLINGMTWSGYYYDLTAKANSRDYVKNQVFSINIYDSNSDAVFNRRVNVVSSGSTSLYQYSVDFDDISLKSDNIYFLQLTALDVDPNYVWTWQSRGETGTAFQPVLNGYRDLNTEMTFSLLGAGSASAVPEPATWAMMTLGFGVVGGAMRRRQKVTTRVGFAQ